jgi:hypothetical protein
LLLTQYYVTISAFIGDQTPAMLRVGDALLVRLQTAFPEGIFWAAQEGRSLRSKALLSTARGVCHDALVACAELPEARISRRREANCSS